MMLMFGLMLMLKTAACVERFCWFFQSGPCYVALGDKLSVMMVDAREYDVMIHKRSPEDPVCRIKNDRIIKDECNLFNNRHDEVSVNNRILIINTVIRADSGNYRLQTFNSEVPETFKADLQVIIEGVERFCWFNQSGPCYVALGVKLNLMMVDSRQYDLKIVKINYNKQDDRLCKIKNEMINKAECDLFNNRHDEVSVKLAILIINPVIRADLGNYRAELFNSDGSVTSIYLQVIIEGSVMCSGPVLPSERSSSAVHVLVWCFQMMVLLGLLGGFHIYMRLTSGKKQEDQNMRMRRFREGHEETAED